MYRLTTVFLSWAAIAMVSGTAHGGQQCNGSCHTTCPKCHTCCVLKAECGKEEKSCWEVECEEICIPCVVFPWQKSKAKHTGHGSESCAVGCSGCSTVNNGARVKTVRKLKKKTYECPQCKYEWSPDGKGNGCCSAGCCTGDCCETGCDAGSLPAGEPAVPPAKEASDIPSPTLYPPPTQPVGNDRATAPVKPTTRRVLSDR